MRTSLRGGNWLYILFFSGLAFIAERAISFSAGAPTGVTGSYADGTTCATCHVGTTPQVQPGWITSNIPPQGYVPGSTYTVTATASGQNHVRFGFEVSPMDSFGSVMGSMNEINSTETQIIGSGVYITHTFNGNSGNNLKSWSFEWIAPSPGVGDVTFYGAFNVANDNGSNTGDTIYTSTMTVMQNTVGLAENPSAGNIWFWQSGNDISYRWNISRPGKAEIRVFDLNGNEVAAANVTPGKSGKLDLQQDLPSGIYFIRVHNEENLTVQKLAFIR